MAPAALTVPLTVATVVPIALVVPAATCGPSKSVTRPTRGPAESANHSVLNGPAAIASGAAPAVSPSENGVTTPSGVIRASVCDRVSVTQTLPSAPAAIPVGRPFDVVANSVTSPSALMRPTCAFSDSVNHIAPSGPFAMPNGTPLGVMPSVNSVISPAVVMRPTRSLMSVNQSVPAGPLAIEYGRLSSLRPPLNVSTSPLVEMAPIAGTKMSSPRSTVPVNQSRPSDPSAMPPAGSMAPVLNLVIVPSGVILAIVLVEISTNHMLASGPAVMPSGVVAGPGPVENSVTAPSGVTRPTTSAALSVYQRLPSALAAIRFGLPETPAENSWIVTADAPAAAHSDAVAAATTASARERHERGRGAAVRRASGSRPLITGALSAVRPPRASQAPRPDE